MKLNERKVEYSCQRFSVIRDEVENGDGSRTYTYIEKPNGVGILAYSASEIILVEQYRHVIGKRTLELPGGRIEPGETPFQAARRELYEETGLLTEDLESLASVYIHPALCNEQIFFFTTSKFQEMENSPEFSEEDLEIRKIAIAKIPEILNSGQIESCPDAYALSVFYSRWEKGQK